MSSPFLCHTIQTFVQLIRSYELPVVRNVGRALSLDFECPILALFGLQTISYPFLIIIVLILTVIIVVFIIITIST